MHHGNVSNNFAWLPHNVDPSMETPEEYKGMPVTPFADRQQFYDDLIQGCIDHYGKRGSRCLTNEAERIAMSLRQPKVSVHF
jgi:prolyl 4-hydroxylase